MVNINDEKTVNDKKNELKEDMNKSDEMFHQIDTNKIQKDNTEKLNQVQESIDNLPSPDEIDENSLKEYAANIYLLLKNMFNVTKELNNALSQINENTKELINNKRSKDFAKEDAVDNSDKDIYTRMSDAEKQISSFQQFFGKTSAASLAKLVEQLSSYSDDPDIKSLSAINYIFGDRNPKEIKNLIDSLVKGSDGLRVVKSNGADISSSDKKHNSSDNEQSNNKQLDHDTKKANSSKSILDAKEESSQNEDDDSNKENNDSVKNNEDSSDELNSDELKSRTKEADDTSNPFDEL